MVTLLVVIARPSTPAEAATAPGFRDVTVIGGIDTPLAMRFSPDGRIFVAEKGGRILVFSGVGDTAPRTFADLSAQVHNYGDRGLLGLALPPDFPANPWVYVLYSHDAPIGGTAPVFNDNCGTPPGPTTDGCTVSGRLSRLQAAGDRMVGAEQVLIEGWCQQFPSHSVGDLAFGPDGALYVSGGDGASYNGVDFGQLGNYYAGDKANPCGDTPGAPGTVLAPPTAAGGALRSQSLRRPSGAPALLNGTVLRVDPTTGAGLPGNPLAASPDPNARRIIASGLRNPFRFTFRPGTNELWVGDVGWNETEEINRIADVGDAVAENFGWPCFEGNVHQAGYDAPGLSICADLYRTPAAVTSPVFGYSHQTEAVPGDGCGTGGSSISGVAFNTGTRYPTEYAGALFFSDFSRNCIWAMHKDPSGTPDPSNVSVVANAVGPVGLQVGPDGYLYYVSVYGALHRLEYSAPVPPPTGGATRYLSDLSPTSATNGWGPAENDRSNGEEGAADGLTLSIDGRTYAKGIGAHAFSDLRYTVPAECSSFTTTMGVDDEVGANGSVVFQVFGGATKLYESGVLTGPGPAATATVAVQPGSTLRLVTGDAGDGNGYDHADWAGAAFGCTTGGTPPPPPPSSNTPPTPVITTAPAASVQWKVGDTIQVSGSASDAEDGPVPAADLKWELVPQHCPDGTCHNHGLLFEQGGISAWSFVTPDLEYPSHLEIRLTATDRQGLVGTTAVRLDPRTVVLTFQTKPGGLKLAGLVVGSAGEATPVQRTVIVDSRSSVTALSPQKSRGSTYSFVSWSDGGAQNHDITAPATNATYTATYRKQ